MSAIGTKRTWHSALQMSAFEGKADIGWIAAMLALRGCGHSLTPTLPTWRGLAMAYPADRRCGVNDPGTLTAQWTHQRPRRGQGELTWARTGVRNSVERKMQSYQW